MLFGAASPPPGTDVPSAFEAERLFATPRVAADGSTLRLWLDTDGFGFVYRETVDRYGLTVERDGDREWTTLPAFDPAKGIPKPGVGGRLPIYERSAAERADPILSGCDGQLGASWFQDRVWTIDYRVHRIFVRTDAASLAPPTAALEFEADSAGRRYAGRQYPRVRVRVDGSVLPMSLDLGATVALAERGRKALGAGPLVRATSFASATLFEAWVARHPDWHVVGEGSAVAGVRLIQVPSVRLGTVELGPVWFSTRPNDDVFDGETVVAKLGGNAFALHRVVLDYPNAGLMIA